MSVPTNPHPDKTATSSDSVVSIFPIKLTEHETDVQIVRSRDSLTLQLLSLQDAWEHCGDGNWTRGKRKETGSYLWKAGCNNSALAQEAAWFTPHCRLSGIR